MSNQLTVFQWIPRNEDFLKKFLRRLERMEAETWIEKKYGFFGGADPWNGAPAADVLQREIEITTTGDSVYHDAVSFRFRGGTFNIDNKVPFDYGRCILYLCEDHRDDLHVLLYDRQSNNWYFCVTHHSTIDSFLNWIQHHL